MNKEMSSAKETQHLLVAKSQSASNMKMVSDQGLQPNAVAAFEELRISDVVVRYVSENDHLSLILGSSLLRYEVYTVQ